MLIFHDRNDTKYNHKNIIHWRQFPYFSFFTIIIKLIKWTEMNTKNIFFTLFLLMFLYKVVRNVANGMLGTSTKNMKLFLLFSSSHFSYKREIYLIYDRQQLLCHIWKFYSPSTQKHYGMVDIDLLTIQTVYEQRDEAICGCFEKFH